MWRSRRWGWRAFLTMRSNSRCCECGNRGSSCRLGPRMCSLREKADLLRRTVVAQSNLLHARSPSALLRAGSRPAGKNAGLRDDGFIGENSPAIANAASCWCRRHEYSRFLTGLSARFGMTTNLKLYPGDPSRAGDDFVGSAGEDELYATVGVGRKRCGNVQVCESDGLGPVAIGVVVAASVEHAAGDCVVADAFGMAVAKDQHSGLQILRGAGRCRRCADNFRGGHGRACWRCM